MTFSDIYWFKDEHACVNLLFFSLFRQKISKEEIPEVTIAIKELEAEWDKRWMDTLKVTPLVSFLNEDPVSGPWDLLLQALRDHKAHHNTNVMLNHYVAAKLEWFFLIISGSWLPLTNGSTVI